MTIIPYKHQTRAIERFKSKPYGALFNEAGTGKSFIVIRVCEEKPDIRTVFIFVPKTLIRTWSDVEIPKHSTQPYMVLPWFHGDPSKSYLVEFKKVLSFKGRVYIILNHDAIGTSRFDQIYNYILKARPKGYAMIIDESTCIKSIKAQRTKKFIRLGKTAAFKLILSGTPVTNSPLDVFTQAEFLQSGLLGSSNFYSFKTRFAILKRNTFGNRSFDVVTGYRDLDELRNRINKFAEIVKLADCVDLPDRIFKEIDIELTEEQFNHYEDLRKRAITYIKEHEITTVNALSLLSRLQQILAGQMKLPDGRYVALKSNRLDTLQEQFEENEGKKIIVWSNFVQTAKSITEKMNGNIIAIPSSLSPLRRQEEIDRWRTGKEQGLLLNPQSASHGLTLNEAKVQLWFDRAYSLEFRLQALARNFRIGQKDPTLVVDFITRGTIEEKVLAKLRDMESVSKEVISKAELLDILGD